MNWRYAVLTAFLSLGIFTIAIAFLAKDAKNSSNKSAFTYNVIDPIGPREAWGKSVGDIDGDGLIDIIVGGYRRSEPSLWGRVLRKLGKERNPEIKGDLVWYQNPGWQKHLISNRFAVRTDLEVGDLNGDKQNDLIILTNSGLFILWAPQWNSTQIDNNKFHDVELADFDNDGDMDIVTRNQSLFNHNNGNVINFYRQDSPTAWEQIKFSIAHGEGLAIADMNADGLKDVIVNRYWLENPGKLDQTNVWAAHEYAVNWAWDNVFIATGDFNQDGKRDVVLSPAEGAGQYYQISWFQAPANNEMWQQHVIDLNVEAVHHFVAAADVDSDGDIDVLTSEMNHGVPPNETTMYLNHGQGEKWVKQSLGVHSSHSMRLLDADGDSDMDLFGAQWRKEDKTKDYQVELWINNIDKKLLNTGP